MPESVVVVGGGLAGAKTVEALRDKGYDGPLALIAGEDELPYERPPLSKDYLLGKAEARVGTVHDADWYTAHEVDLRRGVAATGLDTARRVVTLASGDELSYDAAVLATGSSPRRLPVPGADGAGVHYLRTVADAELLRGTFTAGAHLVVIGAGWIGLEAGAAARQAGVEVTVIESGPLPLLAALGPEIAEIYLEVYLGHGVAFRPHSTVAEVLLRDGSVRGVRLGSGEELTADAVLVGIGAVPNLDLARGAGLTVGSGVRVGADLRSSDPHVWAVGDIAEVAHPFLGRPVRVEHWAWALNQPAVAAASILGEDVAFDDLPYFFSDQYDLGMEYIGAPGPDDRVVLRGSRDDREFVAFWLDPEGRVRAGMNVNVWDVVDDVKALITSGRPVDAARLQDTGIPLGEV